jgi:hypothetical protein
MAAEPGPEIAGAHIFDEAFGRGDLLKTPSEGKQRGLEVLTSSGSKPGPSAQPFASRADNRP